MEGDGRAEKPTGDGEATQILALAGGCHQPRTEAQKAEVALPGQEQGHLVEHGTVAPWASWRNGGETQPLLQTLLEVEREKYLGLSLPSSFQSPTIDQTQLEASQSRGL